MLTNTETYTGSPSKPTIKKDPDAVLDYTFNWADYLAVLDDALAEVEFILDADMQQTLVTFTDTTATVWIGGGVLDRTHRVTCRITTQGGRIDDRSIFLKIKTL